MDVNHELSKVLGAKLFNEECLQTRVYNLYNDVPARKQNMENMKENRNYRETNFCRVYNNKVKYVDEIVILPFESRN